MLCAWLTSVALLVTQVAGSDAPIGEVLGTGYGTAWTARLVALVSLAAVVAARLRVRSEGRAADVASLGLVVVVAAIGATMGHLSTGEPGGWAMRFVALSGHTFAAWAWAGGLAALVIVILPLRTVAGGVGLARTILRRFWLVATPGLAIAAISGIYLAGQEVATPAALAGTPYGLTLILKVLLVLVAASLGLLNAVALHRGVGARAPRLRLPVPAVAGPAGLPRRVVLESAAATAVVLVAAALASSPPARGPAWDPAPAAADQRPVTVPAADLLIGVSVRPNRPGPNFIDVTVLQTRKPAPAPVRLVTIGLTSGAGAVVQAAEASSLGDGHFQLPAGSITTAGRWQVSVSVQRAGLRDAQAQIGWDVLPPGPAAGTTQGGIATLPLAPLTSAVASLLALVLGTTVLALGARALVRRRTGSPSVLDSIPPSGTPRPTRSTS